MNSLEPLRSQIEMKAVGAVDELRIDVSTGRAGEYFMWKRAHCRIACPSMPWSLARSRITGVI